MKLINNPLASIKYKQFCHPLFLVSFSYPLPAEPLIDCQSCLLRQLDAASPRQTVADIKAQCDNKLADQPAEKAEIEREAESDQQFADSLVTNRHEINIDSHYLIMGFYFTIGKWRLILMVLSELFKSKWRVPLLKGVLVVSMVVSTFLFKPIKAHC
jgi:hypothetical protein